MTIAGTPRQVELILDDPYVPWFRSRGAAGGPVVHGRGYGFLGEQFSTGQALVDAVEEHCRGEGADASQEAFREIVAGLNGCWALVAEWSDGHVIVAVDKLRSIPLFYAVGPDVHIVSSSCEVVAERLPRKRLDEQAALDYLLAGYVTGPDTLVDGVKQLQAGEMLEHRPDSSLTTRRYYRFLPQGDDSADEEELERELEAVLERAFARFVRALGGRRLLVPLSGGVDSRLVAGMLKRYGAENVLCYTYGLSGNGDAVASEAMARVLGYDWQFVEYNGQTWAKWMASEDMRRYWPYAMQGCSLPHFQDLPAVAALTASGHAEGAVFLPGFEVITTGDHLSPWLLGRPGVRPPAAAAACLRDHLNLWLGADHRLPGGMFQQLLSRLESQVRLPGGQTAPQATLYECWDHDNRQGKFIVNSARVYEFYGHDWALPLWDQEIRDFYTSLGEGHRWHRRLYVRTLGRRLLTGDLEKLRDIPLENGQTVIERPPPAPSRRRRML
ncbi:hypothetical protein HQ560_07615, partial [bacterium]|nr:hypothetical protein [bacterium]